MTHFTTLDSTRHGHLRMLTPASCPDDHRVSSTGVVLSEIDVLTRYYPIVLLEDETTRHFHTAAVLGLKEAENLFEVQGRWRVPVKPLNFMRAPFAMNADGERLINPDSALLDPEGVPVFEADGSLSAVALEAMLALDALQTGITETQAFIATLLEFDLLMPCFDGYPGEATVGSEMRGTYIIDGAALRDLPDAELMVLHRCGYLETLYRMLASASHFEGMRQARDQAGRSHDLWLEETAA